jgi:biotin carboxyl carrier protein
MEGVVKHVFVKNGDIAADKSILMKIEELK